MTGRTRAAIAAAIALVFTLTPLSTEAASRYDRLLRFRVITTPHFLIYYHQREEPLARRLAAIAEDVHATLGSQLRSQVRGRTHVILVDQNDLANGWATPLPYNTIEIAAAPAAADEAIGSSTDWMRLVFIHEYTHILHLDRARGWAGGLRRVFGRSPWLFPNLLLPQWQVEGLATFYESQQTGEGRLHAGDFRVMIGEGQRANRFEPIDRVNGGLVGWPGGTGGYLYGAEFHQYLASRFGERAIQDLADSTAGSLPYTFAADRFRSVFGRSPDELWADFGASRPATHAAGGVEPTRLTRKGFEVSGPRWDTGQAVLYSTRSPHGFPTLERITLGAAQTTRVTSRYLGSRHSVRGDLIVFDQIERVRDVALQSDLYVARRRGAAGRASVRQLTHGGRASDPDLSPDGRTIACIVTDAGRRSLAILRSPAGFASIEDAGNPILLRAEPDVDYLAPRWSPDGRWIAVARRQRQGDSSLVLVNADDQTAAGDRVLVSTASRRIISPAWLPDSATVLFAADGDGRAFDIYAADVDSGDVSRVTDLPSGAHSPDVSPDGGTLVFVGYTADGYDLFTLPIDRARWQPSPSLTDASRRRVSITDNASAIPSAPYRPWSTLAPRYWTPVVSQEDDEWSVGAETTGSDVLGRHLYAAQAGVVLGRGSLEWSASYVYDRWKPRLFGAASWDTSPDDLESLEPQLRDTLEVDAGVVTPWTRVRWSQTILGSWHGERQTSGCARQECDTAPVPLSRHSVRAGWSLLTRRHYGYSISAEDGVAIVTTIEQSLPAADNDNWTRRATADARVFMPGGLRHAVVALRAAAGVIDGNNARLSAAGSGPKDTGFDFDADSIGLLRGFSTSSVVGTRAAVVNLDYRFPIAYVERGYRLMPIFLRSLHGAVFADAGTAWTPGRRQDVRTSVGAELSADGVLGYYWPVSLTTGVAWRRDPSPVGADGAAWFLRFGRAF